MNKTSANRRFLIYAMALLIAGLAGGAAAGKTDAAVPERPEPRYNVAPGARDPFFAPASAAAAETRQNPRLTEPAVPPGASPAEVIRARLRLSGVLGAREGSEVASAAIINGNIYRVGEALDLPIQGEPRKIVIKQLLLDPPRVIVSHGGEDFVLSLNKPEGNE